MTTEIVLMNSGAVVLAADSTVTLVSDAGRVHYQGVDKIFGFSTNHQFGMMVSGSPNFVTIPWEIVIKQFRDLKLKGDHNNSKQRDSVEHYANEFKAFVKDFFDININGKVHLSEVAAHELLSDVCRDARKIIDNGARDIRRKHNKAEVTMEECANVFESIIIDKTDKMISRLRNTDEKKCIVEICENSNYSYIEKKLTKNTINNMNAAIGKLLSTYAYEKQVLKNRLFVLCYIVMTKTKSTMQHSKIVMAGFGKNEYLPSCIEFDVYIRMDNKPAIIQHKMNVNISFDSSYDATKAHFEIYGEGDSINTFISGVSDRFMTEFKEGLNSAFLTRSLREGKRDKERRHNLLSNKHDILSISDAEKIALDICKKWKSNILQSISNLPKHFLGSMAENLIILSSIRNKVNDHDGSVGGPVSVAIISKGDGFVWIKREHYFDIRNNPHYSSRYSG